jgi:hypothetical protein
VLTGNCLCEGVRFEIHGALAPMGYCHCKQCQRASGSAFAANTSVALADWKLLAGKELIREFESSPGAFRAFCSRCGSPVYKRLASQPDSVRVRLGLVNEDPGLRARAHVWVDAKAAWHEITDSLPQLPQGLPPRKG